MCGIAGIISPQRTLSKDALRATVTQMTNRLAHRGPDASGTWQDQMAGVALGHRRLAIIDPTPAGRQPLVSASGRLVISYNGEVYNFPVLREELIAAGYSFRSRTDTEVVLAAIEHWGIEDAVTRFVGMFAFAVYDQREKKLYLCRDRIGIKPLYYGHCGELFVFASELKAFHLLPGWQAEISSDALQTFLRYNYVPTPQTIHPHLYKLSPGCILTVEVSRAENKTFTPRPYWSLTTVQEDARGNPLCGSEVEVADELEKILRQAVRDRLVSDVPLGVFLSGGIDSSLVTALMQAESSRPVQTFSIGFADAQYNEAANAKTIAKHLGCKHTELYVTAKDALAVVPQLPTLYDEPFADASQIPTVLLSRLTREQVTVALTGDGGDEVFGGYNRYTRALPFWKKANRCPLGLRKLLAGLIHKTPLGITAAMFRLGRVLGLTPNDRPLSETLPKLASILDAPTVEAMYSRLVQLWQTPPVIGATALPPPPLAENNGADAARWMMRQDLLTYHPDDILVKVDRASMAASLEARLPLIDHRVIAFAARLPTSQLIASGQGKQILRRILSRHVPTELFNRPKKGFAIPLAAWLREPLRDWAEELLSEKRLLADGYLEVKVIREKWREQLSGRRDWSPHLWGVLMFNAWLDNSRECFVNSKDSG